MTNEKQRQRKATRKSSRSKPAEALSLFRMNIEVGNLDEAAKFYGKLFGLVSEPRRITTLDWLPIVIDLKAVCPPSPSAAPSRGLRISLSSVLCAFVPPFP